MQKERGGAIACACQDPSVAAAALSAQETRTGGVEIKQVLQACLFSQTTASWFPSTQRVRSLRQKRRDILHNSRVLPFRYSFTIAALAKLALESDRQRYWSHRGNPAIVLPLSRQVLTCKTWSTGHPKPTGHPKKNA